MTGWDGDVFYVKLLLEKGRSQGHIMSPNKVFPQAEKIGELQNIDDSNSIDERLSRHLANFVDSMTVYTEFMPMVFKLVPIFTGQMFRASMEAFLKKNAKSVEVVEDGKVFELSTQCIADFVALSNNTIPSFDVIRSLTRNVLMGLIALFDQHIREAMRIALSVNPQWLESAKSTMTLEEIFSFSDLRELRERSIETEVDRISRESRNEQMKWFEQKFTIEPPIHRAYERWPQLMEICERRNLFAHTNGYVNNQYLDRLRDHKYDVSKISVGEALSVSADYYREAVSCIFEFGVMLNHVIRKKMTSGHDSLADAEISELGFRLINRGDYDLAVRVLKFAYTMRNISSERVKKTLAVNYANALKLSGQKDAALKVLKGVDWTASSTDFEICVASIKGDVDGVVRLLRKAKESGMSESAFREWPVFFEVREAVEFQSAYKEVFGLPYSPGPKKRDALSEFASHLITGKDKEEEAKGSLYDAPIQRLALDM